MSDQTNDNEAIIKKIIKLLAVAASTTFAEEAATAAAMAQSLMTQYNLDVGALEKSKGAASGEREKAAIKGGFYKYTRDLYASVARLNFCTHWIAEELQPISSGVAWRKAGKPENFKAFRKVHKLIGRKVNVASTRVMCSYIEEAIERILKDHLLQRGEDHTALFSRYSMSFREGAVANIIERIDEQRAKEEEERQRKAREEKVRNSHPGSAPAKGTALVLADYEKSEEAANYDVRYGEGAWARRLTRIAKWEVESAMEDEGYECLKVFHPDLYKKFENENIAYWAKMDKRSQRSSSGPKEKEKDWSGYRAGEEAGADISLNQQVDHEKRKQLK